MTFPSLTTSHPPTLPQDIEVYRFTLKIVCYPVGGKTKKVTDARQPGGTEPPEVLQSVTVRYAVCTVLYVLYVRWSERSAFLSTAIFVI